MKIKNVSRIGFSSWRPSQKERERAVSLGVLGKVVVDNERVLAVVAEELANRGACERSEVLHRVRVRSRCNHDRCVFQGAVLAKGLNDASNVGHLLATGNVDAVNRVTAARLVSLLLIDNCVNADRGLTSLTVADNQFALTATNRNHRVDRLDTRLEGLGNRLSVHNTRRAGLESAVFRT